MMPAFELVDHAPEVSAESGVWQLWLRRPGWCAVCYLHDDGHVSGTSVRIDGITWHVAVLP